MLKKCQRRQMTDEQRKWIERQPGVIVHDQEFFRKGSFYHPRIQAHRTLNVTASDLINVEDDQELSR